jgi:hypothetical protein
MCAHHLHTDKEDGMNQSKKVESCISLYLQCKRYHAQAHNDGNGPEHDGLYFVPIHSPSGIKSSALTRPLVG